MLNANNFEANHQVHYLAHYLQTELTSSQIQVLVWAIMEFGLANIDESGDMLQKMYAKLNDAKPLLFNYQFVRSILLMVADINRPTTPSFYKNAPLAALHGWSVLEFAQRQIEITHLKNRVRDVGCIQLGKVFTRHFKDWAWFEDFLLIKLLLIHGFTNLDEVISDELW